MNPKSLALSIAVLMSTSLVAEKTTPLRDDWQLQSACKATAGGEAISTAQYSTEGWLKTAVPSTVLAAQVRAGVFPDPYFGDNLRKIPGTSYPIGHNFSNLPMPADSPYACGWWYRKEFTAPALSAKDNRLWLHFGGIN
jgi:exo-1,4-beta-D-glucosaminidase